MQWQRFPGSSPKFVCSKSKLFVYLDNPEFLCSFFISLHPLPSSQHSFRPKFLATAHQLKEEGFKVSSNASFFFFKLLRFSYASLNLYLLTVLFCSSTPLRRPLPGSVLMTCPPLLWLGPLRRKDTPVYPVSRGLEISLSIPSWIYFLWQVL